MTLKLHRMVFATGNEGKASELRTLLPELDVESLAAYPLLTMPPETGETFEANALAKAQFVSETLGVSVMADDSGLEVDALAGAPGVRSARYAPGSDRDRCEQLLKDLAGVRSLEGRRARFVCALAFVWPGGSEVVRGVVWGHILFGGRGEGGFGYDPIFQPEGDTRSMAELSLEEKNACSHRAAALRQILPMVRTHFSLGHITQIPSP